jgi:hypothetical protein
MALKGTLKDFNLADIFQLIGIQRKTGVLTLKSKEHVVTVSFVNGEVVAADSLHRRLEDRLGTVLMKSGRITDAQLQEALRVQKSTLKRMGNILIENGFIDASALREALQIQISQMIYRLFRWSDGEYNFSQEQRVEYDTQNVVPMSAESILMEGARILDEWPMIEKGLKSFETVFRRANVEIASSSEVAQEGGDTEDGAQAVHLSDEERRVYDLVDGKRSVQEIVEHSVLSEFDSCRILYELLTRQLVEEVRAPGQKVTAAAAPVPLRETSPILLGIGYLLLVLLTGGVSLYRAQPWLMRALHQEPLAAVLSPTVGDAEVGRLEVAISRSRLQRIEFALQVYYLLGRGYPEELDDLVTGKFLHAKDLRDPWGRTFGYERLGDDYTLVPGVREGGNRTDDPDSQRPESTD